MRNRFTLVAASLALVALPLLAHAAPTVDEGCEATALAAIQFSPPAKMPELVTEIDRRIAATLAEERRFAEASGGEGTLHRRIPPLTMVVLGALCVLASLRARRRALLVISGIVLLVAGATGFLHGGMKDSAAAARARQLLECHLRLAEAKGLLAQMRFARCNTDLAEADEDLVAWSARLRAGQPVTPDEVDKTHREISVQR